MTKKHFFVGLLLLPILFTIYLLLYDFIFVDIKSVGEKKVKKEVLQNLSSFDEKLSLLDKFAGNGDIQKIKSSFLDCRMAYKKIEYIIQFLQDERLKYYNGADIPTVNNSVRNITTLAPEGLQAMEGIIYDSDFDKAKLGTLIKKLKAEISRSKSLIVNTQFDNEIIFAALRFNLIRIETMNISGFDVPICKNTIPELITNISTIKETITKYGTKDASVKELNMLCGSAIDYLSSCTSIDNFDRLAFIKNYLQPLNIVFFQVQSALKIPIPENLEGYKIPVQYQTKNIYSPNFINTNLYNEFQLEPASDNIRNLGKLLFFDPLLSKGNKLSCASCHQPEKSFTDGLPKAITNQNGIFQDRNAPTLLNASLQPNLFYDMRATSLENQIEHVVMNPNEFDTDVKEIIQKLEMSSEYIALFKKAFPDLAQEPISGFTIFRSLGSFVRSLQNTNSPFDHYMLGTDNVLSTDAKAGFNVFMGKGLCGTCHFAPTFYGNVPPFYRESETEVIGILKDTITNTIDPDLGRYNIRNADILKHSFKTPTVRNITKTAPYMHNGIYSSLEEIIDFYQNGGGAGAGADVPNQTLPFDSLSLSNKEKIELVAFLQSLEGKKINVGEPILPKIDNQPNLNNRRGIGY